MAVITCTQRKQKAREQKKVARLQRVGNAQVTPLLEAEQGKTLTDLELSTVESEVPFNFHDKLIEVLKRNWYKKRDRSLRVCVDYRKLNGVSQLEAYPMPRIEDLVDQLGRLSF